MWILLDLVAEDQCSLGTCARYIEALSHADLQSLSHYTDDMGADVQSRPLHIRGKSVFFALSGPINSLQGIRKYIDTEETKISRWRIKFEPNHIAEPRNIKVIRCRKSLGLFEEGDNFKACEIDDTSCLYLAANLRDTTDWFCEEQVDGEVERICIVLRKDDPETWRY